MDAMRGRARGWSNNMLGVGYFWRHEDTRTLSPFRCMKVAINLFGLRKKNREAYYITQIS